MKTIDAVEFAENAEDAENADGGIKIDWGVFSPAFYFLYLPNYYNIVIIYKVVFPPTTNISNTLAINATQ